MTASEAHLTAPKLLASKRPLVIGHRGYAQFAPEQVIGALGPPKVLCSGRKPAAIFRRFNGAWLRELQKTGAKVAVWNQQVSPKGIQLAHHRGIKVWVYTVNTQRRANRLLNLEVDGMITDNISLIWRTIALRGGKHGRAV